ncbi:hypothetical protein Q7P37_003298 [Cladosporium fusiforme]
MVLGYSNFFHLSKEDYRQELKKRKTFELQQQEIGKTRGRISSGLTTIGGILAVPVTAGGSLIVSGIGARKLRVADNKRDLIREELASRGKPQHKTDAKDVAIAGGSWLAGNMIAGGIFDVSIDGLVSSDVAGSTAATGVTEVAQAYSGESTVSEGFIAEGEMVPDMASNIFDAATNPVGPGLEILATDAGQHALGDVGALAAGSTGAFGLKEAVGDVISEGISKGYAHAFENGQPGGSSKDARIRAFVCDGCGQDTKSGGAFMYGNSIGLCKTCHEKIV